MDSLIHLANYMADQAREVTKQYFRKNIDIEDKADLTPVTMADRAIETALRQIVEKERPQDGILGEEFGIKESKNGYSWVFDPIDGTKSFTIGRPTFGTLIALCHEGVPVLGMIDQAISDERWIGVKGRPTTFNGQTVKTRPCTDLKKAVLGTGSATQIEQGDPQRFHRVNESCRYMVFNGDCYFYGLMANGWMDGAIEDYLGLYDFLALVPVIEGAGGKITDWNGKPLTMQSGTNCVATGDPALHEKLLAIL